MNSAPPPGWYPHSVTGEMAWWTGSSWSKTPPPPTHGGAAMEPLVGPTVPAGPGIEQASSGPQSSSGPSVAAAVTGLALVTVGYFLTSTWFSLIFIPGLGLAIYSIVLGRQRASRANLVLGIFGTTIGAIDAFLTWGLLAGYGPQ